MAKKRARKKARKGSARATSKRSATARRKPARRTPRRKTARPAARRRTAVRAAASRRKAAAPRRKPAAAGTRKRKAARAGGTGRERDLAQTPRSGRSVRGRTNPLPTKRSTGTPAGAGSTRRAPSLDRARRQLRETEESVGSVPSSLTLDRTASAARTGRQEMREALQQHTETGPVLTAGDVDANWAEAYAVGDEAPGGDNPTPDQDRVDDIGKALGVQYQDNEELRSSDKIADRDRHRWELDPASAEDYTDRD